MLSKNKERVFDEKRLRVGIGIGALVAQTLKFLKAGTKQVFAAGVRVGLMIDLLMQLLHHLPLQLPHHVCQSRRQTSNACSLRSWITVVTVTAVVIPSPRPPT